MIMAKTFAAVGASSSMAQVGLMHQLPAASLYPHRPALPCLLPRSAQLSISASASFKLHSSASSKLALFQIKASSSEETSRSVEAGEIFSNLKEKWDAIENKSTVILYGGGALVALWFSSVFVDAINSLPLVPKVMEFVGLGYTGWFVYRYLLFKSSRKELADEIVAVKKKIIGSE